MDFSLGTKLVAVEARTIGRREPTYSTRASAKSFANWKRQLVLGDDLDDAVGGAAKRERILRTGGAATQGEHSGDGVGLVGDGQDGAFERRRNSGPPSIRADSGGRWRRQWLRPWPWGAEDRAAALWRKDRQRCPELGELLHQLGSEIGLGEVRGLEDHAGADRQPAFADDFGNQAAQLLNAARSCRSSCQGPSGRSPTSACPRAGAARSSGRCSRKSGHR